MRAVRVATAILLVVLMLGAYGNLNIISQAHADIVVKRDVTLPVKVVFVGIDPATVDTSYMKWNYNVPSRTYQEVDYPQPSPTGVLYNVDYSFTFASDTFKEKLLAYLGSIQTDREARNPWFYYYSETSSGYVTSSGFWSMKYSTYDANTVEDWFYSNQNDLGGFPANGWTIMLLNLPELPSFDFPNYRAFLTDFRTAPPNGTAHYYSVSYKDSDLGYRFRYRDFMTGWGGVHRFWFDDLSAGPSFWTGYEDIPLQIALQDNNIDLKTTYGRTWFTQYLSDYIWQATWNLITPSFVYEPLYSQKYSFHVHVFDNRTSQEKSEIDIKSTIDADPIKKAFQDLFPYSPIEVTITFENMANYPDLRKVIHDNYKYTDSFTFGINAEPLQYAVVDARPVYKYLQDNLKVFEPNFQRSSSEFTVPVFAFAFSERTLFTFTYKWFIADAESNIKALLGVALGDMALVSESQHEFDRGDFVSPVQPNKGYGFTEVVIHESGHMVGLAHPHDWGPIGDFTFSAMGYYTWDYTFGQSDKDAVRRAHVDQVYVQGQSALQELSHSNAQASDLSAIQDQLKDADAKYSQMDYVAALKSASKAESLAQAVMRGATIMPGGAVLPQTLASAVYVIIGLAVGLAIGIVVMWLVFKRGMLRAGRTRGRARRRRR